jgi:arginine/lysine/ornithine decarboxylase
MKEWSNQSRTINLSTPSGLVEVYPKAFEKIREIGDNSVSNEQLGSPASVSGVFRWVADQIEICLGADWGRYLHSGTSFLNSAVIEFFRRTGRKKILIQETSHKSLYEAVARYGLRLELIPSNYLPEYDSVIPPTLSQVEDVLRANSDASAVILTSPTYDLIEYEGYIVRELSELIHAYGMVFMIDAAWAHPPSLSEILKQGVDIVVNSVHKLNGSYQGGSMIGVSLENGILSEDDDLEILNECWREYLGTSPSYPILVSIGAALEALRTEPRLLELPRNFTRRLSRILEGEGIGTLTIDHLPGDIRREFRVDGWKLQVKTKLNGYYVKKACEERFVVLEKAGPNHVQLIGTFKELLKASSIDELAFMLSEVLTKVCLAYAI